MLRHFVGFQRLGAVSTGPFMVVSRIEMASTEDMAWAAGLFEGEGCIVARTRRGPTKKDGTGERRPFVLMELMLVMTDRDVVERFNRVLGVGNTNPRRRTKSTQTHWKDQWVWRAGGTGALALYEQLRPYLGERRRRRGDEVAKMVEISRLTFAHLPRPCEGCGESFIPKKQAGTKFCSDRCRDRIKMRRYRAEGRTLKQRRRANAARLGVDT